MKYEPFSEAMLLALFLLTTEQTAPAPDELFYSLVDNQTDEECAYYMACLDMRDWINKRDWAHPNAPERLAYWHQTA